jgi:Tfp pilus assembly protein PilN
MNGILSLYISYMKAAILGILLTGGFSLLYGMLASGRVVELTMFLAITYAFLKQQQKAVVQRSLELDRLRKTQSTLYEAENKLQERSQKILQR